MGNELDGKALDAVSKWRFEPANRDGVPISMSAVAEITFRACMPECAPNELLNGEREKDSRRLYETALHQYLGNGGFQKDDKVAFLTMHKAAKMGFPPAETKIGQFYANGIGVPVDKKRAFQFFDLATFHGDTDGEYELGLAHLKGLGTISDAGAAYRLLTHAAERDHALAQEALGQMLETGTGVPKNLHQAMKWYRKSAEQGEAAAQYHLAEMYWNPRSG